MSRFDLKRVLGEGGGGIVHLAVDRETGETVALKMLGSSDEQTLTVLRNEFRIAQGIHHPNLVRVQSLTQEDGRLLLAMEYVEGVDFQSYVAATDATPEPTDGAPPRLAFDEPRLRSCLRQLAEALAALHRKGRVHRDIKPSNILVTRAGRLVVLDFGVALDVDALVPRADLGITGSPLYMAPEQVLGEGVGPPADWYAMGVLLFRALTGSLPFEGSPADVMEAKVTSAAPDPRARAEHLPADLVALCTALLEPAPTLRPSDDAVLARLGIAAPSTPPPARALRCIGRDAAFDRGRAAFADVRAGRSATLIVEGESGSGKSLFVRALAEELLGEADPPLVLFGRCYEREEVPFKAFSAIVDELADFLVALRESALTPLLGPGIGLLPIAFPEMKRVAAISARLEAASPEPKETRRRLFAAFRELMARLAHRRTVVLVIDDLQWADQDSVELLGELTRSPGEPPLFLLCTQRTAGEATGAIASSPHLTREAHRLRLDPLTASASIQLAKELAAQLHVTLDDATAKLLADEAKGHPMFLAELVRQRASTHERAATRLDDALRARVSSLPASARRLLVAVCLAGLPMPLAAAGRAAALEPETLSDAVARLRADNFAITAGSGKGSAVEPYHDRVREAVVASVEADALAAWHERIARALEAEPHAEPEMMAREWLAAGNHPRAAEWALVAADAASAGLAFDRAARLYELALGVGGYEEDEARALRLKLAEALTNAGRWAESAHHRLLLADGREGGVEQRRVAAEHLLCSGHFDRGVALLEEILRSLGLYVPESRFAVIVAVIVAQIVLRLRGLSYVERPASAIAPMALARVDALASAGYGFSMTDHIRSRYFMTRGLLLALRVGEPERVGKSLAMAAGISSGGGVKTIKETTKLIEATRRLVDRLQTPLARGLAQHGEAFLYLQQRRLDSRQAGIRAGRTDLPRRVPRCDVPPQPRPLHPISAPRVSGGSRGARAAHVGRAS